MRVKIIIVIFSIMAIMLIAPPFVARSRDCIDVCGKYEKDRFIKCLEKCEGKSSKANTKKPGKSTKTPPAPVEPAPATTAPAAPEPTTPAPSTTAPVAPATTCPAGMALIPAGEFTMGCVPKDASALPAAIATVTDPFSAAVPVDCDDDEMPATRIRLNAFCMDITEVTQENFKRVMGANPSSFAKCGPDCPVENVFWKDAKEFCEKSGKRLSIEAEWEYAARGGTATDYYWGDAPATDFAWNPENATATYEGNFTGKGTQPVAKKKPNAYGLYDMSGNVWEWTADCYQRVWYKFMQLDKPANLSDDCSPRVLRGGSWSSGGRLLRSSQRNRGNPKYPYNDFGFRCAAAPR